MKTAIACLFSMAVFLGTMALAPVQGAEELARPPVETPEQHAARMKWWQQARFGMFIHWGIYSVPAGEYQGKTDYAEWFLEQTHMPVSQYSRYAKQFNPIKFDAKEWVGIAKDAGMKYIVITSKHHDGFGMWPSNLTDWCIKSTPFGEAGRDPIKELSEACKDAGIRLGLYHSIMDWHHPDWGTRRPWNDTAGAGKPDMDRFDTYLKGQLKEIVTVYHPGVLWFDGEWESPWTHERGVDLYAYLRKLDPNLIINNRIDKARGGMEGYTTEKSAVGDYGTPEQQIPPKGFGPGVDWETCMTINDHWGYNKQDHNFKSAETLLRNLIDIASHGGNYLLNVGPTAEGVIPAGEVQRLKEMGAWLKVNGEAIYDTGPTAFGPEAGEYSKTKKDGNGKPVFEANWGWRCTTKPGKIYIEIFKWPGERFTLTDMKGKVTKAYLLADRERALSVVQTGSNLTVSLPAKAPDPIASVLCLEVQE
jgi:alpha-L-fucosidase